MGSRASMLLQQEELAEIKKETGFSFSQITHLYSRFTSLDRSGNGTLSWEDFERIPELVMNPLGERLISAFFAEGEDQVNFRGFIRTLAYFRPTTDTTTCIDDSANSTIHSNTKNINDITCGIGDTVDGISDTVDGIGDTADVIGDTAGGTSDTADGTNENGAEPLNSRSNKLFFAFRLYDLDRDNKISRDELLHVLRLMVGVNISDEQLNRITDRTIRDVDQDGDGAISFPEFVQALKEVDIEQKMSIQFLD